MRLTRTHRLPLVLTFGAALVLAAASGATREDLDLELARDPGELVTTAGKTYRGTFDGMRDGRLQVRRASDGGEVGYSFAPSEIARLTLPGADLEMDALDLVESGRVDEAMPMLEALGRHRIRYLPVLNPAQQKVLWTAAEVGSRSGDAHTMLGITRAMALLAATDAARSRLLEAELRLLLRLKANDEAGALARRWCETADPCGRSALGWLVLAESAYAQEDYGMAQRIALQPVTFSGYLDMEELDRCYVIAIAAADRLGDTEYALTLRNEMRARGITWPLDTAFDGLNAHYSAPALDARSLRPFYPTRMKALQPPAPTSLEGARWLASP